MAQNKPEVYTTTICVWMGTPHPSPEPKNGGKSRELAKMLADLYLIVEMSLL